MGSEGEGGTPKPTARRTFPASPAGHRPEPAARARCSRRRPGAPTAEVGFATTAAQGRAAVKPPKNPPNRLITAPAPRRIARRRCQAGARPGTPGRIVEVDVNPVERAVESATDLFPRGASVLAACSGGPDSVALAAALVRSAPALGIRVFIGHV